MENYIISILEYHNGVRKLIEQKVEHFPKAKKLPPLRWDEELSVVAMRVTNFCNNIKAHNCVNVPRFLNVARNSGDFTIYAYSTAFIIRSLFKDWLVGYKLFKASYVHEFPVNATIETESLANIINQRVDKVGCGLLIDVQTPPVAYFTCLYNEKIRPGKQLYETDP